MDAQRGKIREQGVETFGVGVTIGHIARLRFGVRAVNILFCPRKSIFKNEEYMIR
jgi:hypothetical protein